MTEDDFKGWKQNEVTKLLFKKLKKEIEEKKDGLVWNSYDNAEIVKGYIRAYSNILDMEIEDLIHE